MSISIGSPQRDHTARVHFLGEEMEISRVGTDGDIQKAAALVREYDGKVDAFGLGGMDLFLTGRNDKKYVLRAALPVIRAAEITPFADGTSLKNTLEYRAIKMLRDVTGVSLKGLPTLLVCAMDRSGMARALVEEGADAEFGDLMFALGINKPIRSIRTVHRIGGVVVPIITHLPYKWIYPTGDMQKERTPKYELSYARARLICGDYLYIMRHMPLDLKGKIILTNTVTAADIRELRERGAAAVVTTTPHLDGRSFGTNAMEAAFIAHIGQRHSFLAEADCERLLDKMGYAPTLIDK